MPFRDVQSAFDEPMLKVLQAAYAEAWDAYARKATITVASGNEQEIRNLLAKRIIEAARVGERDTERLKDYALAAVP